MSQNETSTSTVLLNGEQAKNELAEIEIKAKSLRKSMKEALEVGDLKGWNKYKKDLADVNKSSKALKVEAFDAKKVLDDLSGSSVKDLESALKKIQSLMKNGTIKRHSKEWDELKEAQIRVKKEIKNVNAEMSIGESRTSKFANGMNKYFTMLTAGVAAFTGVVFGAKQMIQSNAELSDSFADVMKTTNLTQGEVQELYKDFKSLDTRTARKELLQLASDAGKLGIEGKKNILDFVDAGNQIKVSLGEDLGEDAIKNIGKMVGVFSKSSKELQGLNLKEQMLAVGSAVNSIGQNSSASEEYLVAFAARLGGVSKQAGIGIDAILGYASALDQDMQQVEMSATALQNFIMKIMGDPAKFAKIAGMEVKAFTKLLDTDANAAIKKVLKALDEKGGFQALIPIFQDMGLDGARAVGVLSSLAGSIDKIDKEQLLANKSLAEGTSITKEYNIRNSNLAASLAKLNQNISSWFKNSALTSWLGGIVSGLEKATAASKTVTQEFKDQSEKVLSLKLKIEPLLARYDELALKTNKSASENSELKKIIAQVTAVMPGATTAVDQYGNAISISTGRVREFINAEVARYGVVNKKAIEENKDLLDGVESQLIFHKKKIDEINKTGTFVVKTVTDKKSGDTYDIKANAQEIKAEQAKYQKLLQDRIGYTAEIDRLSGTTLKKQMDDAEKERKLQQQKSEREKAYYKMSKAELQKLIDANDELAKQVYNDRFPKAIVAPEDKLTVQKQKVDDAMQALENENLKKITSIKKQFIDGDIASEIEYNETLLDNQEKYDGIRRKKLNELLKTITDPGLKLELNKQIADIDKKALDRQIDQNKKIKKIILDADPIAQEKESHDNRLRELGLFGLSKENMTTEQLETLRILEEQHSENMRKLSTKQAIADLKQLEKDQQSEEMLLSAERLKTQMDEQSYKDKLIEIEVRYLRKKLAIQGLSADEIDRIMKQLNQRLIEGADKASQDMASFLNKYGLDELGEFKVRKELELKLLQKYLDDGIVKEKHAARIRAILASEEFQAKTQDFKTQADAIAKTSSDFSSAFQGFQQAEEKAIETRYQKEIDAASKAGKDTTKLEAAKNKELAELRAENADAMFALQAAMIISSTAVSAIDAYASALKVPVIGLVLAPIAAAAAVAYGGSQLAQANAAREAAKEGYYNGGFHDDPDGFTGGTNPREVRGRFADGSPVHGLEYVADHVTTANPTFRKIFNLAEYAKKTNTVARISDRDIMQIMNSSRGFYEGGYHTSNQTNGNQTTTIDLSAIDETIRQTNAINALLLAEIKKGIVAKARISGNDGIAKGIEDYNKLVKNAKG